MASAEKIVVRFTAKEWSALHAVANGELESLTKADYASGIAADLVAAQKAMEMGRRRAAKGSATVREP